MIEVSSNAMVTIMTSSNDIAMILIMTVINRVVVRPMGVTLSMVSLTSITMVEVEVRGGRIVVLTDITILGILLNAYPLQRVSLLTITLQVGSTIRCSLLIMSTPFKMWVNTVGNQLPLQLPQINQRLIQQPTLIDIITRSKGGRMIVVSSNAMVTIVLSSNDIAMILSIMVINGVVIRTMNVTLSMVSLTSITMVGVEVRGGRIVVLTDITILGM